MYTVQHYPSISEAQLRAAGEIVWHWDTYPQKHFGDKDKFLAVFVHDYADLPCVLAYRGDYLCGGITYTQESSDFHFPGVGRFILGVVVHPLEVGAGQALMRSLRDKMRGEGLDWFHISKRVSETEFRSHFRRL